MPVRTFIDSAGVNWRVWATVPTTSASVLSSGFEHGWLTFECDSCVRRLAPIPRGWEEATAERLDLMCRAAREARRTPKAASDLGSLEAESRGETGERPGA